MSVDNNKAVVHRFYEEVWNKGNFGVADDIFAAEFVRHDLRPSTLPPGPEGRKLIARMFRAAFPDVRVTVDLMVAEADLVVARWIIQGTHRGTWAGTPPTGREIIFAGVTIFRIANGKVGELWDHRDDLGLTQSLGAPVYADLPEQRR